MSIELRGLGFYAALCKCVSVTHGVAEAGSFGLRRFHAEAEACLSPMNIPCCADQLMDLLKDKCGGLKR